MALLGFYDILGVVEGRKLALDLELQNLIKNVMFITYCAR